MVDEWTLYFYVFELTLLVSVLVNFYLVYAVNELRMMMKNG